MARHGTQPAETLVEHDGQIGRAGNSRGAMVREREERELAAHVAVADALAAWQDTESGFAGLLAALAESLDYSVAVLWVPHDERLRPRVVWQEEEGDFGAFKALTVTSRLPRGVELPGRVWEQRRPGARGRGEGEAAPRRRAAQAAGLRGEMAFPALWAEEVLAVIELGSREEPVLSERLSRSLNAIGSVIGHFLAHRRGVLQEQAITDRQVEVLTLAADGLTGPQIAERLRVSQATVKTHFEHTYERLGVNSRAAAVAEAIRLGLVD